MLLNSGTILDFPKSILSLSLSLIFLAKLFRFMFHPDYQLLIERGKHPLPPSFGGFDAKLFGHVEGITDCFTF